MGGKKGRKKTCMMKGKLVEEGRVRKVVVENKTKRRGKKDDVGEKRRECVLSKQCFCGLKLRHLRHYTTA